MLATPARYLPRSWTVLVFLLAQLTACEPGRFFTTILAICPIPGKNLALTDDHEGRETVTTGATRRAIICHPSTIASLIGLVRAPARPRLAPHLPPCSPRPTRDAGAVPLRC